MSGEAIRAAAELAAGSELSERDARVARIVADLDLALAAVARRPLDWLQWSPAAIECAMGNRALLWWQDPTCGRFATFGRWRSGGFKIRKGSKGVPMIRGGRRPGLAYAFRARDIDGLERWAPLDLEPAAPAAILSACELVAGWMAGDGCELVAELGANRRAAGMAAAVVLLSWQGLSWRPELPADAFASRAFLRVVADASRALAPGLAHACGDRCPVCAI